ncbi:MAG: TetR/AcrR family transcriptional regulator [Phenylobacterium sp.]|uniref:TetR/AcrR family transcriptional regulator n=1 Tax=Phenylobacterium sp. TaxID=1871053 RepID=UPI00391BC2AC
MSLARTAPAPAGRREAAKTERRRRIIAAARDLIRETGDAGLSMRAIAARAGVSLATPYNLFGSKRAIVLAILEDVREFHERFSRLPPSDALGRLFEALAISIGYYAEDPDFYHTLWSALLDTSGKELRTVILNPQSHAFWAALIAEAGKDGAFAEGIDPDLLLRNLNLTFEAVMLNWVHGAIGAEELEPSVSYGYALALRGAASPAYAARLDHEVRRRQARLRQAIAKKTAACTEP